MRMISAAMTTAFLALSATAGSALTLDCNLAGANGSGGVLPQSAQFFVDEKTKVATMTANGATLQGAIATDASRFVKLAFGPMKHRDAQGDHAVTLQLVYVKSTRQASVFAQIDGADAAMKATGYCTKT